MARRSRVAPVLHGTYRPPALRRGDRVDCLFRDALVIVTTWHDAPIPWPRGYVLSESRGGGPGLIVEEELARAVRRESALAIRYWWGVSNVTVSKWRKALGVTLTNNPETSALMNASLVKARAASLRAGVSEEERQDRSRRLRERKMWLLSPPIPVPNPWPAEAVALLGTMIDAEVARRTGRTLRAVRGKRRRLGIPPIRRGGRAPRHHSTPSGLD